MIESETYFLDEMNGKTTYNETTINFSDSVVQRGAMTSDIKAAVEAQLDAVVRNLTPF